MNDEMKVLMEAWRSFVNENKDPKNQNIELPKGTNSAGLNDEDLEEGHHDPDEQQPDHEGDNDGEPGELRWDTP